MPAVGCSCIFDMGYFRSLPHYCEGRAKLKRGRVYSRKRIEVSDKNKSLNHQKLGAPKGIAYFCTYRLTLRLGQLLMRLEEYFVWVSQGSTNWTRLYCSMVCAILSSDATVWEYAIQMRPIQKSINNKYLQLSCLEQIQELLLTQNK